MAIPAEKTPLYQWHRANGARMSLFGGYEMPLWYPAGAKEEHLAVITRAGLFDTSHMSCIIMEGHGALDILQTAFSKDLSACMGMKKGPLMPGKAVYGVFLDEEGHVIDDALVYKLQDSLYMVCVNAGMGAVIANHLSSFSGGRSCRITDMTGALGKIDIQGPLSARILSRLIKEPENIFSKFSYFSFKGHFDAESALAGAVRTHSDIPVLLSRTGYTGEFGFELFCTADCNESLWLSLMDAGKEDGLIPCGLAARDSLRAGAGLPLSHQDIGDWPFVNHPWPFALPMTDDGKEFTKEFTGAKALLQYHGTEHTHPFAGFDPRKIPPSDTTFITDENGNNIGKILTCTTDMAIGRTDNTIVSISTRGLPEGFTPKGLSCGFVKTARKLAAGTTIYLCDGKRRIKAEIVTNIRPDRTARQPCRM